MHKATKDLDLKKKKHKKHKKHKKTGRVDKLDLHAKKKHKKQKRKHRESDDSSSDGGEKLPTAKSAPTSLSSKFTEIMKTNGHSTTTGLAAKLIKSIKKPAVPTDPTALVEMITQSLDPNAAPSLEIVSSESESDGAIQDVDVDSPDVAVIEDELNLEELMKQKALLQARLGNIASESEEEPAVERRIEVKQADIKATAAAVVAAPNRISDVILLDDSSGEVLARAASTKKRQRSASISRDRKRREERRESSRDRYNREQDKMKQRRNDDNRNKEDLRREIDRDKERSFRDRRRDGGGGGGGGRMDGRFNRDRNRYSTDGRGNRSRSRDRYDRDNMDRGRDRDRGGNRKREEKNDKFVGSLSEGQKADKESSSDSEIGDIKVNDNEDEDDEEKIIEMRRKKREELLKKLATSQVVSQSEPRSTRTDSDEDVVFVQNDPPAVKKTLTPPAPIAKAPPVKQISPTDQRPVVIDDIESTTPPLPAGMLPLKLAAKPEISTKSEENVINQEGTDGDLINHDKVNKIKDQATKRSEWDMFAEQDNYSNFDVSICLI